MATHSPPDATSPHAELPLSHPTRTGTTASLFVALYLLVLAFFIVLTTLGKPEAERVERVLDSVRSTFSPLIDIPPPQIVVKMDTADGDAVVLRSYLSPMAEVAREAVTLVDAEIIERGNVMEITMPVERFFIVNRPEIRPEQLQFLEKMAAETNAIERGLRVEVIFTLPVTAETLQDPDTLQLALQRAAFFAESLQSLNVTPDTIITGLEPLDTRSQLHMEFILRELPKEDSLK